MSRAGPVTIAPLAFVLRSVKIGNLVQINVSDAVLAAELFKWRRCDLYDTAPHRFFIQADFNEIADTRHCHSVLKFYETVVGVARAFEAYSTNLDLSHSISTARRMPRPVAKLASISLQEEVHLPKG